MSVAYLLRVVLPDRPGSLGAVAVALGTAGTDIVSVNVVERNPDGAVDDLVVELPPGALADSLLVALQRVPGVRVVSLRHYHSGLDIHRELVLMEDLAADPAGAMAHLARDAPEVFHAGWAVVVVADDEQVLRAVASSAAAPETLVRSGVSDVPWLPLDKPCVLETRDAWVPTTWARLETEVLAAPISGSEMVLLVGRPGGPPYLNSEVMRVGHLASIAGMVLRGATGG